MDKLNSFSSFSRDWVSCVCWVYVPLYRYIPCISYQVLKKRINARGRYTLGDELQPTHRGDTSAATNRFVRTGEFLWKSLLLQKNFVAATSRTNSVWFEFLRLAAATKFCCGDKDFHRTSPVHSEAICRCDVSSHRLAATSRRACSHGVICRRAVLLQLVAKCVPTLKKIIFYSWPLFTETCNWVSKSKS